MTTEFDALVERARATPIEDVLAQRGVRLRKAGQERIGPCPKCGGDDRFSINVKDNIWNCRGCKPASISGDVIGLIEFLDGVDFPGALEKLTGEDVSRFGKRERDRDGGDRRDGKATKRSEPAKKGNGAAGEHRTAPLGPIVATYDYTDENGGFLFQVTRHNPKDFRQRRKARDGEYSRDGWIGNLDGVRMVPYRLPALVEAIGEGRRVYIVEGEKDVENVVNVFGAPATCNPRGAGKWGNCDIDNYFADADVIIVADHEPQTKNKKTGALLFHEDGRPRFAGWDHAQEVAEHLIEVARSVRVIDLHKLWPGSPSKADISNWIENDGTIEALNDFADGLPQWTPESGIRSAVAIVSKRDFTAAFKPLSYLVEGMLQRGFIYSLTGATSHAKSALALALAELVASPDRNTMFGKHKVEKGRVLYFVGENPDDIRMRVIGADSMRDSAGVNPVLDELYFIVGQIDIDANMDGISAGVAAIGGVDLVIVDTSAAYFLGDDELSNTQMGDHARKLRRLTELAGKPSVIVLCHPIKHPQDPSQLLPRGGGAFLAEMDGNLTAWKHDDVLVDLNYTKMRGPGFEPMTLKLEVITTTKLIDDKGRILPTVRATVVTETEEERAKRNTADDQSRVLAQMLYRPDQSLADIARALAWVNGAGEPQKMRVGRILTKLEKAKPVLVKKNINDQWELTEKGKDAAAQAVRNLPPVTTPEPHQENML